MRANKSEALMTQTEKKKLQDICFRCQCKLLYFKSFCKMYIFQRVRWWCKAKATFIFFWETQIRPWSALHIPPLLTNPKFCQAFSLSPSSTSSSCRLFGFVCFLNTLQFKMKASKHNTRKIYYFSECRWRAVPRYLLLWCASTYFCVLFLWRYVDCSSEVQSHLAKHVVIYRDPKKSTTGARNAQLKTIKLQG